MSLQRNSSALPADPTPATMASDRTATISPYSMAVAPDVDRINLRTNLGIASFPFGADDTDETLRKLNGTTLRKLDVRLSQTGLQQSPLLVELQRIKGTSNAYELSKHKKKKIHLFD